MIVQFNGYPENDLADDNIEELRNRERVVDEKNGLYGNVTEWWGFCLDWKILKLKKLNLTEFKCEI